MIYGQPQANEVHRPSVINRPDGKGYASSDLFIKHPTNDKLWKMFATFSFGRNNSEHTLFSVGRSDDVVVHSTGTKTVPGPIEDVLFYSPL
jgi:hypothetical protein